MTGKRERGKKKKNTMSDNVPIKFNREKREDWNVKKKRSIAKEQNRSTLLLTWSCIMVCSGLCGLESWKLITSSIRTALSARVAWVTHFSTTFDANLCWESCSTLPRTAATIRDLSSGFPCSVKKKKKEKIRNYDSSSVQMTSREWHLPKTCWIT